MSMSDLERALALVGEHADRARFVGPRDPETVEAAEAALGVTLPPTYRRFLSELGAGSLAGREFYGVIDTDFEATVPDAVGLTLEARETTGLPASHIVVADTGYGDWYVLDTSAGEEAPVVIFMPGVPPDEAPPPEQVADDFGAFMAERLTEALS
jgi:hypothetical protein